MFQSFWKLQEINSPTKIVRQSLQMALQPWQVPTLTLTGLCQNNPTFAEFLNYRCTIAQQTLRTQVIDFNLLKPTGHVVYQQFNIQQLYVLPTLYLCVLYLSENKQRLVPLTA